MLTRFAKTLTPLPVHPLYLFTLSLALGIIWQANQLPLYIPLAFIGLISCFLFVQRPKNLKKIAANYVPIFIVATGIFCVGALRYQQGINNFNCFYQTIDRRPVKLVARVIDCEPSYKQLGTFVATLTIEQAEFVGCKNRTNPAITGHKFIAILPNKPPFRAGDTILLNRILFFPPAEKSAYANYLVKSGIVAHIQLKPENVSVLKHPISSFYRTLSELRNNILESAKKQLSPPAFALFTSIFWGKHAVDQRQINSIRDQFRPWGILHYLARAGLHVTMLIILLEKTISFLPLPFMIRTILGAGLISGYALISWSSISFIRALLVFFIFILCTLLWAPSQGLYRLALACFLILLWNPFQLFFLDFQLSFLVTAVFMWMSAITRTENS